MRFIVGCETHLQLIVLAADPAGSRGYINSSPPTSNGSSTVRSCPIAARCDSRTRLSGVASHRLPNSQPARRIASASVFIRAWVAMDCILRNSVLKIVSALAAIERKTFESSNEAPICAMDSCTVRPPRAARRKTLSIAVCAEVVRSLISEALNCAATWTISRDMPITGLMPRATRAGSSTNWLPSSKARLIF
jgi:hypothetical protein